MTRPRTPPREPQTERDTAISVPRQAGPAGASYSLSTSAGGPGRWIYVSGQLPFDGDGRRVERPLGDYSHVRGEPFPGNLPASTAVGVATLIGEGRGDPYGPRRPPVPRTE
jgi:hypothetical protein